MISGLEHFDKVISVDQAPIAARRAPTGDLHRPVHAGSGDLFATVPAAKEPRLQAPDASRSTSRAARLRSLPGDGVIKVEMHFLPDVYVPCDVCHGKRYNARRWKCNTRARTSPKSRDDGGRRA